MAISNPCFGGLYLKLQTPKTTVEPQKNGTPYEDVDLFRVVGLLDFSVGVVRGPPFFAVQFPWMLPGPPSLLPFRIIPLGRPPIINERFY